MTTSLENGENMPDIENPFRERRRSDVYDDALKIENENLKKELEELEDKLYKLKAEVSGYIDDIELSLKNLKAELRKS